MWKKKSVAISLPCSTQRKMACWGPPHPFPYTSFKNIYITQPNHDAAGSTRCNLGPHALGLSRLAQGRVCCVSWCILAAKSGTVLVRKPQVKTICNHTKSIYEYYSCSAVSTIATLGYSLYICIWQFIKPLQLSIWYTIIVFRYC